MSTCHAPQELHGCASDVGLTQKKAVAGKANCICPKLNTKTATANLQHIQQKPYLFGLGVFWWLIVVKDFHSKQTLLMDTESTLLMKNVRPDILIPFSNFFILFFYKTRIWQDLSAIWLTPCNFLLIICLRFKGVIETCSMWKHCPLNNYNHEMVYKIFFLLTFFFPTRILISRFYLHWNIHGV